MVNVTDLGIETEPASLVDTKIGPNEIHLPVSNTEHENDPLVYDSPEKANNRLTSMSYYVPDHVRNFLNCVKSRKDPIASVEVGYRSVSVCHLGNIAMRLHRKIRWDPAKEQIIGDDEAAAMLTRPMRAPWRIDS